jgi:hypothetical protein
LNKNCHWPSKLARFSFDMLRSSSKPSIFLSNDVRYSSFFIPSFGDRIYSSYVNAFDSALIRLQSWTLDSRPSASSSRSPNLSSSDSKIDTSVLLPNLSTSQRKRIKSFLKVCF